MFRTVKSGVVDEQLRGQDVDVRVEVGGIEVDRLPRFLSFVRNTKVRMRSVAWVSGKILRSGD